MPGLLNNVAGAIGGFLNGAESWADRAGTAAYVAPSGRRLEFDYFVITNEASKRVSTHRFPGVDGVLRVDHGHDGYTFPWQCYFTGRDCDLAADAFEELLLEKGQGTLQHPQRRPIKVVPLGTIVRRDDLARAGEQSVVEVEFGATLTGVYPTPQAIPQDEVLTAFDRFQAAAASGFASKLDTGTVGKMRQAVADYRQTMKDVRKTMGKVSAAQAATAAKFTALERDINLGLDTLIGTPLKLAAAQMALIRAPGRLLEAVGNRIAGYADYADYLLDGYSECATALADHPRPSSAVGSAGVTSREANAFAINELSATSAVGSAAIALVAAEFTSRAEALAAATKLSALHDQVTEWRETEVAAVEAAVPSETFQRGGQQDSGEAAAALTDTVALTLGYLVERAFDLRSVRVVVLDRPRTLIDIAFHLFRAVDDRLDELILNNDLRGSEILMLPRGKAIRYLV